MGLEWFGMVHFAFSSTSPDGRAGGRVLEELKLRLAQPSWGLKLGLGLSLAKTARYAIFTRQIADWQQIAEKSNTVVALAVLKLSLLGWGDKLGQANWYDTSTSLSEIGPADTKPNHKGEKKVHWTAVVLYFRLIKSMFYYALHYGAVGTLIWSEKKVKRNRLDSSPEVIKIWRCEWKPPDRF